MHFLVTRPQPDCRRTAEKLRALGHVADEAPVLKTVEVGSAGIGLEGVSALAFSSRRAVAILAAHSQIDDFRKLPVFTVGDATALACREAGFPKVHSASGNIDALAQLILDKRSGLSSGEVLYPAAEDRAGDLEGLLAAGDVSCRTVVVYRMDAVTRLPSAVVDSLNSSAFDGVLIYSRRTAEAFVALVRSHGLDHILSGLPVYALSRQSAEPLSEASHVRVAAAPNETSLLDLALTQC
ncbi:uroporphyrinogen-III synthase [Roseibium sp. FZY0029]|uniref:uroporphyrinogen-III synthase n=1 Tax=Roseibium sp. FZY0029 TaxID=3116647 RepID=UPI002EC25247|nr:uroporphyrinogen-III synthase [Roseibium sp. FZY0029]